VFALALDVPFFCAASGAATTTATGMLLRTVVHGDSLGGRVSTMAELRHFVRDPNTASVRAGVLERRNVRDSEPGQRTPFSTPLA
jgi:hypothetical protein